MTDEEFDAALAAIRDGKAVGYNAEVRLLAAIVSAMRQQGISEEEHWPKQVEIAAFIDTWSTDPRARELMKKAAETAIEVKDHIH